MKKMGKLISLEKDPNIKISNSLEYFLDPDFIYIPAENIQVHQNEFVYKNMPVCKNYCSSISGIAYGLKKRLFHNGVKDSLVIANDFRELENTPTKKRSKVTIKNILSVLNANNKTLLEKFKSQNKFDNIVITAINDEPYVYNHIFILKENITDLLELLDELSLIYKTNHNYLIVKNIDTTIINDCLNVIGTYPNIELTLVNDEYLLEREEFIFSKLQINNNTLYLTTQELLELNNYLLNKDNTTTLLTISGNALKENKTIRVKKYTLLKDILTKYFELLTDEYVVIVNGLMQGYSIKDTTNLVIDDQITAINIMKPFKNPEAQCINCGQCLEICPKGVNPLTGKNIAKCINCGLCTYICLGFVNLKNKIKEYKNDQY